MTTICIKTPVGKKLGPSNFAPTPHGPLSLTSSRRPFLNAGVLAPETPHIPHIVECVRHKFPSTLPRTIPGLLEADARIPWYGIYILNIYSY